MENINSVLKPETWVKEYSDLLYKFAYFRVGNKETARDLVQDTFLSAIKNKEGFKGEISERNWLYTILKNKIIDHYRKKSASAFTDLESPEDDYKNYFDENDHWRADNLPRDWSALQSTAIETKEFYDILQLCLKLLSEIMHSCFEMKYIEDKEAEEICKELCISSSNYWVILHRAKLQLRNCLEKNWFGK